MTQKKSGASFAGQQGGQSNQLTSGTGPLPKQDQSGTSLVEHDSPDDVETGAQSNTVIERP